MVVSHFNISGYQIRSEASMHLAQLLVPLSQAEHRHWLQTISGHIQNQGLEMPVVEKKHIELAIREVFKTGFDEHETVFSVINAFDVPKMRYCEQKRKFLLDTAPRSLLPSSDMKPSYMRDRYTILWQTAQQHELFNTSHQPMLGNDARPRLSLKKIELLLSTSKMNQVIVLGLLTQLSEGKFYLEDPTGAVPIDLSEVAYSSGLFCEGSIVLGCGDYRDGTLYLYEIGCPLAEPGSSSRARVGTLNTWGGPSKTLLKLSQKLESYEREHTEDSIVFLSDCWLDNPQVMEKLQLLFQGMNVSPPAAIVLMGPFAKINEDIYGLRNRFHVLGELVGKFDELKKKTDLVLVPSCDDPVAANILPRAPIPECLVGELRKRFPRLVLASNPCRLQYCTQQIVVCRADLVTKLCRNTIHFPTTGVLEEHFTRTITSQATLAPLQPLALPVHWAYDAALSLFPLPDVIVVGDPCQGFQRTDQECTVINTGSFPKSKFSFKIYVPSSRTVEDSQIPDE